MTTTCWSLHPDSDVAYDTAERLWVEYIDLYRDEEPDVVEWTVVEREPALLHLILFPQAREIIDDLFERAADYPGGEGAEHSLELAARTPAVIDAVEDMLLKVGGKVMEIMAIHGQVFPWPNDGDGEVIEHRITLDAKGAPLLDGKPMGPFPEPIDDDVIGYADVDPPRPPPHFYRGGRS